MPEVKAARKSNLADVVIVITYEECSSTNNNSGLAYNIFGQKVMYNGALKGYSKTTAFAPDAYAWLHGPSFKIGKGKILGHELGHILGGFHDRASWQESQGSKDLSFPLEEYGFGYREPDPNPDTHSDFAFGRWVTLEGFDQNRQEINIDVIPVYSNPLKKASWYNKAIQKYEEVTVGKKNKADNARMFKKYASIYSSFDLNLDTEPSDNPGLKAVYFPGTPKVVRDYKFIDEHFTSYFNDNHEIMQWYAEGCRNPAVCNVGPTQFYLTDILTDDIPGGKYKLFIKARQGVSLSKEYSGPDVSVSGCSSNNGLSLYDGIGTLKISYVNVNNNWCGLSKNIDKNNFKVPLCEGCKYSGISDCEDFYVGDIEIVNDIEARQYYAITIEASGLKEDYSNNTYSKIGGFSVHEIRIENCNTTPYNPTPINTDFHVIKTAIRNARTITFGGQGNEILHSPVTDDAVWSGTKYTVPPIGGETYVKGNWHYKAHGDAAQIKIDWGDNTNTGSQELASTNYSHTYGPVKKKTIYPIKFIYRDMEFCLYWSKWKEYNSTTMTIYPDISPIVNLLLND